MAAPAFSPPPAARRALNLLWAGLAAALFAVAASLRFRLPQTPISDPDIWCYFNPALSKLLGGPLQHTYGQCFLYPGILYAGLAASGDFRAITAGQHLLGLGTGALLLAAWRQVRGFLPVPRVPKFLYDVAGLAMAAVYLLSSTSVRFEHTLRPEAVFPFFAVLNICLNLSFLRRRFFARAGERGRAKWTLAAGAGAVFTSVAAWLLKPSFSVMLVLANLPVGLSLAWPGASRREKLALAVVSAAAAGWLLVLPEWQLRRGDPDAREFLAVSLFTVHADLIRDQMADDLARGHTAPYDPRWLAPVQARLAEEVRTSGRNEPYPSLGFNPDYVKRESSFVGFLAAHLRRREQVAEFCEDYYRRTWRGRPGAMGAKVGRQLGVFYRFGSCPAYRMYLDLDLQSLYAESAEIFYPGDPPFDQEHPHPRSKLAQAERYLSTRGYLARCRELAHRAPPIRCAPGVAAAAERLSKTYLPLCLWTLALGVAAAASPTVRRWIGPFTGVALLLYAYNFGTTLAIAVGHSMDIVRYSMYQLAYTLLAQAAGGFLAVEAALAAGAALLARCALPLARCASLFAARAEPLPPPARTAEGKFALGRLAPGAWPSGAGGDLWAESVREEFSPARLLAQEAPLACSAGMEGNVLVVIDGGSTDDRQAEAAGRLVQSYHRAPADLISHRHAGKLRKFSWTRFFARLAVGVDPSVGPSVPLLVSWRLYRQVARTVLTGGRTTTTDWVPEVAVQAAAWGFVVRSLPPMEAAPETPEAERRRPTAAQRWRWFALCCQGRPLRCLGALATVCLVLAAGFGAASVHHPPHARHRYVVRRGPRVIAGVLSAAALASAAAGGVLEGRRRRWRRAFLAGQERRETAMPALPR